MGIDFERFVDRMSQNTTCFLCSDVLLDPVELYACGHHFCRTCWTTWQQKSSEKVCAYCEQEYTCVRDSTLVWHLIQNANVTCARKKLGCAAVYKYGFSVLHENQCKFRGENNFTQQTKCTICGLSEDPKQPTHDCLNELSRRYLEHLTKIANLEHENDRLTYKLSNREKEYLDQLSEIEATNYADTLKYNREIRDLRVQLMECDGSKNKHSYEEKAICLERVNGSLGFNIMGGKTQDGRVNGGIVISRIVEGSAADQPKKNTLELHDCVLEVDGVDLRDATHELAVQTFRKSGDVVKMVVRRQLNVKTTSCDAGTQTFGIMFAVTGDEKIAENTQTTQSSEPTAHMFNGSKRWLSPDEIADCVNNLSCTSDVEQLVLNNNSEKSDKNIESPKSDLYDSAYDTLLTQKSSRSYSSSDVDSNKINEQQQQQDAVVLRNKTNASSNGEVNRLSTFFVLPSTSTEDLTKPWEDEGGGGERDDDFDYDFEYEEVNLSKLNGKFGLLLCVGGDDGDVAVYVGDLEEGSAAEKNGKVMVGDQIVQINGCHVNNVNQAYKMLQDNENITLVVARAVYEPTCEAFDEAEETDLDMLDSIHEECDVMSNDVTFATRNVNDVTFPTKTITEFPVTAPRSQNNSTNFTASPVATSYYDSSKSSTQQQQQKHDVKEAFSRQETCPRGRTNDNDTRCKVRHDSSDSSKSAKSSLKNFVKNKFSSDSKKQRSSSSLSDDSQKNTFVRSDSHSSNNSKSDATTVSPNKTPATLQNNKDMQSKITKEQRQLSRMKAYLDSPSIARHRVNTNTNLNPNFNPSPLAFPNTSMNNQTPINNNLAGFFTNHGAGLSRPPPQQMCAQSTQGSLRSAMKNPMQQKQSKRHVQIDSHPGWNATEKRVWEEFKIIQSMEATNAQASEKLDPSKVEAEWRVRRSKDGKHVYIKKTNGHRQRTLKNREAEIMRERCGMTTDDDAFTVYQGQYWNREQRKRQLARHHNRRQKIVEKAAVKAQYENKTGRQMAELVQRNMTLPRHVFDDYVTVEEILSQRNRTGVFDGPIHVTTI